MLSQTRKGWIGSAVLFSLNGRWPLPPWDRPAKARGWDATTTKRPLDPPPDLTEAEIARGKLLLERAGWTLVEAQGVWKPVKTIG
jgi:hypothetical protein